MSTIIKELAYEGHKLPKSTSLVLKNLWFTLDISDNQRRVGLMHNDRFWSNKVLFVATMFFLKLDMRLTDPRVGNGEIGLRRMLLNQRSFSTLARVPEREELLTQLEMPGIMVRYNYRLNPIPQVPVYFVGEVDDDGGVEEKVGVGEVVCRYNDLRLCG